MTPDSPADAAGFVAGDIIVAIGDEPVESFGDVFTIIRTYDVGDTVQVGIVRDGRTSRTLDVTLAADTACEVTR